MTRVTLAANVLTSDTQISVSAAVDKNPQFAIQVDTETMLVVEGPPSSTTWAVIRDVVGDAGTEVLADFFSDRTESDIWGGGWRGDNSDASFQYSASDDRARLAFLGISGDTLPYLPMEEKPRDLDVLLRFATDSLPSGTDTNSLHLLARQTPEAANAQYYRIRAQIKSSGDVDLRLGKAAGGSTTVLGSLVTKTAFITPGVDYLLRLKAIGASPTSLSATLWQADATEPAADVTASDSEAVLQAAGTAIGIRLENTASAVTLPEFSFDSISASRVQAGIAHTSGAAVAIVEEWPVPLGIVVGHGTPSVEAPSGAAYLDLDSNTLYVRSGTTWRSEALT